VFASFKETFQNWLKHKDARLGAALAYYSIFSMGPMIVIAIAIAGLVFGQDAVRGEVAKALEGTMGTQGAGAVQAMLDGVSKPSDSMLLTLIGFGTLIFAAVGVVVQLKDAFNTVWEVPERKSSGVWSFMRTYVISVGAVIAVGFLLMTSLLMTAALSAFANAIPWFQGALQPIGSFISFAVIALLFAAMFKYMPDAAVSWRDVWIGALLTAALFELGKFLIGFYIGAQGLESSFGAAASLVVVLIWVYYSAQLVLFGAEFTRVYAGGSAAARSR
jgi:membrane protein